MVLASVVCLYTCIFFFFSFLCCIFKFCRPCPHRCRRVCRVPSLAFCVTPIRIATLAILEQPFPSLVLASGPVVEPVIVQLLCGNLLSPILFIFFCTLYASVPLYLSLSISISACVPICIATVFEYLQIFFYRIAYLYIIGRREHGNQGGVVHEGGARELAGGELPQRTRQPVPARGRPDPPRPHLPLLPLEYHSPARLSLQMCVCASVLAA